MVYFMSRSALARHEAQHYDERVLFFIRRFVIVLFSIIAMLYLHVLMRVNGVCEVFYDDEETPSEGTGIFSQSFLIASDVNTM